MYSLFLLSRLYGTGPKFLASPYHAIWWVWAFYLGMLTVTCLDYIYTSVLQSLTDLNIIILHQTRTSDARGINTIPSVSNINRLLFPYFRSASIISLFLVIDLCFLLEALVGIGESQVCGSQSNYVESQGTSNSLYSSFTLSIV